MRKPVKKMISKVRSDGNTTDGPRFHVVELYLPLIEQIRELRTVTIDHNLPNVRGVDHGSKWNADEKLFPQARSLVVSQAEFWFGAYAESGDDLFETTAADIEALEDFLDGEDLMLYVGFDAQALKADEQAIVDGLLGQDKLAEPRPEPVAEPTEG